MSSPLQAGPAGDGTVNNQVPVSHDGALENAAAVDSSKETNGESGGASLSSPSDSSAPASASASAPSEKKDTDAPDFGQHKSNSLYVGDLKVTVDENTLYEHFSSVASIESIKVCRNTSTRRSLGYAYVNFYSIKDSERAMEELNYSLIQDHPCRIMWSNRNPNLRKSNKGNVFIRNLDPSIDNKALHDTMSQFGEILSCKIASTSSGKSKGFGFVHYATDEAADLAIKKLNGMSIQGKEVFVARFKKNQNTRYGGGREGLEWTNLYIRNIPPSWNKEKLEEIFAEYGEVSSSKLNKPSNGGKLAYGFVDMGSHDAAVAAVEALHNQYLVAEGKEAEALQNISAAKKIQAKAKAAAKLKERVLAASEANGIEEEGVVEDSNAQEEGEVSEEGGDAAGEGGVEKTDVSDADDQGKATEEGKGTSNEGESTENEKEAAEEPAKIFLYVQRAQRREVRERERREREEQRRYNRAQKFQGLNIYIKNLADSVTDDVLRRAFDEFGTITSAKVMFTTQGTSRGFGFVCYSSHDEANKAISEMQGKNLDGKPIAVSIAQPKKTRGDFMRRRHGTDNGYMGGGGRYHRFNNNHHNHHHSGRGGRGGRGRSNNYGSGNGRRGMQNGIYPPNMYYPQGAMMYPAMMNSVLMNGRGGQLMRGIPMMPHGGYQNMPQGVQGMPNMQSISQQQQQGMQQMMPGSMSQQQQQQQQQQHMYAQQYAQHHAQYQYAQQQAAQQYAAQHHMQMQRAQQQMQQSHHHHQHHQQQQKQHNEQYQQNDPQQPQGRNVDGIGKNLGQQESQKGVDGKVNLTTEQKNYFGDRLYPLVRDVLDPQKVELTGKVTGMLLGGLGPNVLSRLIEDRSSLSRKVSEALVALNR